jgi:hypothetical protein
MFGYLHHFIYQYIKHLRKLLSWQSVGWQIYLNAIKILLFYNLDKPIQDDIYVFQYHHHLGLQYHDVKVSRARGEIHLTVILLFLILINKT